MLTQASSIPVVTDQSQSPSPQRLWTWKDVALISVIIVVGLIGGTVALSLLTLPALAGTASGLSETFMLSVIAFQAVLMFGAVWVLGLRRRKVSWAEFGWRPISGKWVLGALGLFVLMRVVVTLIALGLQALGIHSMQATALAPEGFTWASAIGSVVLTGIAVPIAEEMFYRGVLYRWLKDRWGVVVGLVVSSIIFGLSHVEPATIIPAIFIGLVCAFAYQRSNSLLPPIIIHAANNLFAVVLLYVYLAAGGALPTG